MRHERNITGLMSLLWMVGAVLVPFGGMPSAQATEYHYCGPTSTEGDGWFSDPANWTPSGGPPGSADVATFDQDGSFHVYTTEPVVTNKVLKVSDGLISLALDTPSSTPSTYELLGTGTLIQTAALIGTEVGKEATLRVHGQIASPNNPPAHVNAAGLTIIGQTAGSNGKLRLSQSGISSGPVIWQSSYPTWIGSAGAGTLEVPDGNTMISGAGALGLSSGSSGTAEIKGEWTINGTTTVGDTGNGELGIWGEVSSWGDCYVAVEPGSQGLVEVHENPIQSGDWQIHGPLYVGGDDDGPGGDANVIVFGGNLSVTGDTAIRQNNSLAIYGGTMNVNDVDIRSDADMTIGDAVANCGVVDVFYDGLLYPIGGVTNCTAVNCGGTIHVMEGTLNVTGELYQGANCSMKLLTGGTINVGSLTGYEADWDWTNGNLNITNGSLAIDDGEPLGDYLNLGGQQALTVSDTFYVGRTSSGVLRLSAAGATVFNDDAYAAVEAEATAEIALTGTGTQWDCSGSLYLGGDETGAGGTGTLDIDDGALLDVADTLRVWDGFSVETAGGRIVAGDMDVTGAVTVLGPGMLELPGGSLDIWNGGTVSGAIFGNASTGVALYQSGANWTTPGSLVIGGGDAGSGYINSLVLEPGAVVTVEDEVTVADASNLILGGGTINTDLLNMAGADFTDFGTINGKFLTTGSVTATGDLTIGDVDSVSGVQISGMLNVGPHRVTLNKQGQMFVYGSTTVAGGTLVAPHGFGITPTLKVSGLGVIDTPNDPTMSLFNDGLIVGDSASNQIELTGYLTGGGSLGNVTIHGTDSPGYDGPAAVNRGIVTYAGQVVVEIGGTAAGTDYDQINHAGLATLGGELHVELINGFEPSDGDSFTLLTYISRSGQFDVVSLPALAAGLSWEVNYDASAITLSVVGRLAGDCNMDGNVDLVDYADFVNCLSGPLDSAPAGCSCFDMDNSGTVDLADYAVFQASFTG